MFLLFFLIICGGGVLGGEIRIDSADKFIELSNVVNSGSSYDGSTIYLDSDIDFTGKTFEPIGDNTNYFKGTFDGQGHVVSNLKIETSTRYVGLFGYSTGMSIRNAILDGTCTISSSYESYSNNEASNVGGIIGCCSAYDEPCRIENNVNMANVSHTLSVWSFMYVGGIIGKIDPSSYDSIVRNCVNYGPLSEFGSGYYSFIGGIAGDSYSELYRVYFQNCLNYGAISREQASLRRTWLGGIAGRCYNCYIENCVSAGSITPFSNDYIGGIAGTIRYTTISHCYWNEKINAIVYGEENTPFLFENSVFNDNFELNETVSVGSYQGNSLIEVLNAAADYYVLRGYSHWILNKKEKTVSFTVNNEKLSFMFNSAIILLPNMLNREKLWFDGWYTDNDCLSMLTSFSLDSDKDLFGKFETNDKEYTIKFDTRGGTPIDPVTLKYGLVETLPNNSAKDYCTISHWETEYNEGVPWIFTVPAYSVVLYAVWLCTHITTAADFVDLSKVVNSGMSTLEGTTILLDSDITLPDELCQKLEPIGLSDIAHFGGTFDGQGHIFSNFIMNFSMSQYVGIFGNTIGMTMKNLVIDDSCLSVNSYKFSLYAGVLVGSCYSKTGPCLIENCVNMGSITFNSEGSGFRIGGIAGFLVTTDYFKITMKNCANYGSIIHSGNTITSYMGGIIGNSYGHSSEIIFIQNCFNYGSIIHNGTTINSLYIGGLSALSSNNYIENCLNIGEIKAINIPSDTNIGSITGNINSYSYINITHSFWTSNVGYSNASGYGLPTIDAESTLIEQNLNLVGILSNYALNNSWNKWLFNANNVSVTFMVNNGKGFTVDSQIILLPYINDSDRRNFSGWYSDTHLTIPFTATQVDSDTTLYGMFCSSNYTVSLDVNGGDASSIPLLHPMVIECNGAYGNLPTPTWIEHTFVGWFTESDGGGEQVESGGKVITYNDHVLYAKFTINSYTLSLDYGNGTVIENVLEYGGAIEKPESVTRVGYTFSGWNDTTEYMPDHNLTITAQWTPNNYTVCLDVNGGNELGKNETTVIFNSTYGDLPTPTREGYSFNGWFDDNNEHVTEETIVTISSNHTLHAQWTMVPIIPAEKSSSSHISASISQVDKSSSSQMLSSSSQVETPTNQVEIIFESKDLTKEDIEKFVKEHTSKDVDFTINVFKDESGVTRVIVKFADAEIAREFVRSVRTSSESGCDKIKSISFTHVSSNEVSFLSPYHSTIILFYSILFLFYFF